MERVSRNTIHDGSILSWFESARSVDDFLPLDLDNGAKLTSIHMHCAECKTYIEPENARADLFTHDVFNYRMHSLAYCKTCESFDRLVTVIGPHEDEYFVLNVTKYYPDPFARNCLNLQPGSN